MEYLKQEEYPQLQLEAAWTLSTVVSGTTIQCQSVIDKEGIPLFSKLLLSRNMHVAEKAIWAIGNIASDCIFYRDSITRSGGVANLVQLLSNIPKNSLRIEKHGCWALSNLCRGNPLPRYNNVESAIPVLCRYIQSEKIVDR